MILIKSKDNLILPGPYLSELYRLTEKDIPLVAEIFLHAYRDYPFTSYLSVNVDKERINRMATLLYRFNSREGIRYGEVYAPSPNIEGAAIWKDSSTRISFLQDLRAGALKIIWNLGIKRMKTIFRIMDYCTTRRKTYAPPIYKHLSALGVDPTHQGKGFASKLIRSMLTETDKKRNPCVLETQTENNIRIYQHLGFQVVDESEILSTGIKNYIMVRPPQ